MFLSEPSLGAAASPTSKALVVEACGAWSCAGAIHSTEVSVKPFQWCLAANRGICFASQLTLCHEVFRLMDVT